MEERRLAALYSRQERTHRQQAAAQCTARAWLALQRCQAKWQDSSNISLLVCVNDYWSGCQQVVAIMYEWPGSTYLRHFIGVVHLIDGVLCLVVIRTLDLALRDIKPAASACGIV